MRRYFVFSFGDQRWRSIEIVGEMPPCLWYCVQISPSNWRGDSTERVSARSISCTESRVMMLKMFIRVCVGRLFFLLGHTVIVYISSPLVHLSRSICLSFSQTYSSCIKPVCGIYFSNPRGDSQAFWSNVSIRRRFDFSHRAWWIRR